MVEDFAFGQRVRDTVTKVEGVVVGRAEYQTGYRSTQIAYQNGNGTLIEDWLETSRLEAVDTYGQAG